MNTTTLNSIAAAAPFLCTPSARNANDYLESHYRLSLAVLNALSDGKPRTCKDIAALIATQPAWQTVNQVLLALRRGGIELMTSHGNPEGRTWQLPGGKIRHRKVD